MIKPKERRYVKVEALFLDEISGLCIIKPLGLNTYDTLTVKVKFERNKAFLEATNDLTQGIVFDSKRAIAVLDTRSLGCKRSNKESYSKDWENIILLSHCKIYL